MHATLPRVDVSYRDPMNMVEEIAASENWSYDRCDENEVSLSIPGSFCDYHVSLSWRPDLDTLHMACVLDLRIPPGKHGEIRELVTRINENLWLGHFDLWSADGGLMFRHGLLLAGGAEANVEQCRAMIGLGVEACERYLPAFQFLLWAGKTPRDALAAVLFETLGTA